MPLSSAFDPGSSGSIGRANRPVREVLLELLAPEAARKSGVPGLGAGFFIAGSKVAGLQALQAAAVGPDAPATVLAARYRVAGAPVFGTVVEAFERDLVRLTSDGSPIGHFEFKPSRDDWIATLRQLRPAPPRGSDEPRGNLGLAGVTGLMASLANLPIDRRVVLFIETDVPPDAPSHERDLTDWTSNLRSVVSSLPQQVGIVAVPAPAQRLIDSTSRIIDAQEGDTLDWSGLEVRVGPASQAQGYRATALRGDRPARIDSLGYGDYAQAIARFVLHPKTEPLTIGIHGEWGKGKSTFMGFIDEALVDSARANQGTADAKDLADLRSSLVGLEGRADELADRERVRSDSRLTMLRRRMRTQASREVVTASFNAWQYESAPEIWAGLAIEVTQALERSRSPIEQALLRVAHPLKRARLLMLLAALVTIVGVATVTIAGVPWLADVGRDVLPKSLAALPQPLIAILALVAILAGTAKLAGPVADQFPRLLRQRHEDRLGYQHVVIEDLKYVRTAFRRGPPPRVVVFVDDLDRCSEERVVEVLQAINLILAKSDFFVFLGIDTDMIHRAIDRHYHADSASDALPPDFAKAYLRKIIQLSFHLPITPKARRQEFGRAIFGVGLGSPPAAEAAGAGQSTTPNAFAFDIDQLRSATIQELEPVETTWTEVAAFLDYQLFVTDNPRELIRLVNLHRLVKITLYGRGVIPTDQRQRKLLKWLVFCVRWPDLIDDALTAARAGPDEGNVLERIKPEAIAAMAEPDSADFWLFVAEKTTADILSSQDLLLDGEFERAAYLSELITSEPPSRPDEIPEAAGSTTASKSSSRSRRAPARSRSS